MKRGGTDDTAAAKERKRVLTEQIKALPLIDPTIHDFTNDQHFAVSCGEATRDYKTNGLVFIRVADRAMCHRMIKEQWDNIICKQAFTDRPDGPSAVGVNLDEPLSTATLKEFMEHWPMHRDFGASCDPQSFHMPLVWKHRENEYLYEFARSVMGTDELWADLNRCIHKLPTMGGWDFLHLDCDPTFETQTDDETAIQGKLMWSTSQFIAVPGSHLRLGEYVTAIAAKKGKTPKAKWNIDADNDPLEFWKNQTKFRVPAGCVVFWSNRLVHGHTQTARENPIEWGMYMGYIRAESRSNYHSILTTHLTRLSRRPLIPKTKPEIETFNDVTAADTITEAEAYGYDDQLHRVKQALKLGAADGTELADRVRSFAYQTAPILWPSCDIVQYAPYKYKNFPNHCYARIRKCAWGDAFVAYQTPPVTKQGVPAVFRLPVIVPTFEYHFPQPQLSPLGLKLLGVTRHQLDTVTSFY